jgi:hypothetical protein
MLNGTPVDAGADAKSSLYAALGTSALGAGGNSLAEARGITGTVGNILKGEGRLGTSLNGALGNAGGGLLADLNDPTKKASDYRDDALANAAAGAAGNLHNHYLEAPTGGGNLSEKAQLMDSLHTGTFEATMGAAMSAGYGGIENDLQSLRGTDPFGTVLNKTENTTASSVQSSTDGLSK